MTRTKNLNAKIFPKNNSGFVIIKTGKLVEMVYLKKIKGRINCQIESKKLLFTKKYDVKYMNINNKSVGFKNNIKNCGLIFRYYIRSDPLLGIGHVSVRLIRCSYSKCLSKLAFP